MVTWKAPLEAPLVTRVMLSLLSSARVTPDVFARLRLLTPLSASLLSFWRSSLAPSLTLTVVMPEGAVMTPSISRIELAPVAVSPVVAARVEPMFRVPPPSTPVEPLWSKATLAPLNVAVPVPVFWRLRVPLPVSRKVRIPELLVVKVSVALSAPIVKMELLLPVLSMKAGPLLVVLMELIVSSKPFRSRVAESLVEFSGPK